MSFNSIDIVSTRTLLDKNKLLLSEYGIAVYQHPFIEVNAIDVVFNSVIKQQLLSATAMVFSSQNAVNSLLRNKRLVVEVKHLPCFCVGDKTLKLLESHHFKVKDSAKSANELTDKLIKYYKGYRFVFWSGNLSLNIIKDRLKEQAISCEPIQVYRTVLNPIYIKETYEGVCFFSPSSVRSYLIQNDITNKDCFCIGETTAKSAKAFFGTKMRELVISDQASEESLVKTVINYYKRDIKK